MNEELVSIITPVYNSGRFLEQSITSVLNQTYQNWELRIVDDCSEDNSRQIISRYADADNRIKPLFLNKNSGAGPARNKAIELAEGAVIAFLDSDDIWLPNKLEEHVAFMKANDAAFSHTSYGFINETG
ncbi:MAG: glycosyltransferase family 2 protein, partial [Sinomicrobium sp.]|nr:glycosyltransferase family 2 protein [Sinomicrobium sp.]